jgi:hypothetical protein
MIIEESESYPGLHRMATVQTERGDEYVINVDAAVEALAQFFSDYDNEQRRGWTLTAAWFEGELAKLRSASTTPQERKADL